MKFLDALELEATEQLETIKQYRTGEGDNATERAKRAKVAIGVIGAYVRLRATLANEKSNELIERRLLGGEAPPPALGDGGQ